MRREVNPGRENTDENGVEEKNYTIECEIAEDGLSARLQIKPSGADVIVLTVEDLQEALSASGITYGVKLDVLKDIAETGIVNEWIMIAEGDIPQDGQDSEVVFYFSKEKPTVNLKEDSSGHVNLWDLNLIQNVNKGDVLCEVKDPTPGKPGTTVKGEKIPAQDGKLNVLPKGTNVEPSEDGRRLLASLSGMVIWDGEKVSVEQTYTVDKVDASTGNIRFIGSVVVNGEVGDGFEIQAGEDLTIGMSVGHVTLSAGRDVKIAGGILKGSITAGRDVRVKFIQDATVNTQGSVVVDDYIQNSEVIANGPVLVKNHAGWILGGAVSSEQWIYTNKIGKEDSSANTDVIIGSHPNLIHVREGLVQEIFQRVNDFLQFRSSLAKMRVLKSTAQLPPKQEQLYQKILQAIDFLRSEMLSKQATVDEITDRIHRTYAGEIYIPGAAYGGTVVKIGGKRKVVENQCSATKFSLSEGQIKEDAFEMKKEIEAFLAK